MTDTTARTQTTADTGPGAPDAPAGAQSAPGARPGSQLFRNAYALMVNTGISAVLGLGYWVVAARYYSDDAVGRGSAAVAAMKFLAGLTAVTLIGALARFVPVAGRTTGRLILRTYAASSVVVALAALVFLATLDHWGPSYRFLHGLLPGLGFVLAVVGWSLLTLQDGVLTGLRSARWVPVGNTVFLTGKLVLLIVLATALPAAGVFVSWALAIGLSTIPLGWLVFRRLVPRHTAATRGTARPAGLREMGRFLAGDYTGALFSLAVVYLVPVVVASQVSSSDNAYFYITTTIGGTVNLLALNMGSSLTVEGAHSPEQLAGNCRAALGRMVRIMLPVCGALFLFAPQILHVFGPGYAEAATPLLRLYAVGALLRVVIELYYAVLRARSRTLGLAALQGLLCVLVLGSTLVLLPHLGLTGAGLAETGSLLVVTAIAGAKLYPVLRGRTPVPPSGTPGACGGPGADRTPGAGPGVPSSDDGVEQVGPAQAAGRAQGAEPSPADAPAREAGHTSAAGPDREAGPSQEAEPTQEAEPARESEPGQGIGPTPAAGWDQVAGPDPAAEPSRATHGPPETHGSPAAHGPPETHGSPAAHGFPANHGSPWQTVHRQVDPPRAGPSWAEDDEDPLAHLRAEPPDAGPGAGAPPYGTPVAPPPGPRRTARLRAAVRRPATALWLLLAAALALYWLPLRGMGEAELSRMGGLGLVTVLPYGTLAGAALLVCVFAGALALGRRHRALLLGTLLATVVSLHAVPAVLETMPRFATAWQHLGFVDHIVRTGTAVPDLDARWSWPGFFAGAAFLAQAAGVDDLTGLLRWWPTLLQLACLAPLALLLRAVRAGWRAKWCALWFFALCGWVGQDYFSPQGFTYLFHLLFMALLVVWFRAPARPRGGREPGEADPAASGRLERGVLLAVLLALFLAAVAAHQLTPFVMLGSLAGLLLVRRGTLRGLPLLCAVVLAAWVGLLAEPFWSGHFDELFGGIGGLGGNVSSSVAGRIEGGSEVHKLVLYARVALAAGTLALAACGLLRRLRSGISDRALLVLTAVPFLAFGAQSYGGEIALRVFLFAAPTACVLAALGLFPQPSAGPARRVWRAPVAALLAGLVLMGGFLVARWGNEQFERVRPGEVAALEYVYAHDEPSARVLWPSNDPVEDVTPAMPWGARDAERIEYVPFRAPLLAGGARGPGGAEAAARVARELREAGPGSYVLLNSGQSTYLHLDSGYPAGWQREMTAALDARDDLRPVLRNRDAVLYTLRDPGPGTPPAPDPGPAGPTVTWNPYSVAGAFAAVVLLALLGVREAVRVTGRPGPRRDAWLQGSFWFALPLVMLLCAALVQRFVTLS
ncbi:lipopolysaccharide biosynthesis protein [Streptomyces cacaoi]|uniref:lipopolysaccharide biosynthesis protein n=1 Tax=Streptomyces cacaoi TaxID=1898 RepID=UPI002626F307|nr:lipopolysaccharide biosynthesis protein [Streptomyces cacaoi]